MVTANGTSQELTIDDGSSVTHTLTFATGTHVELSWITGSYADECSFTVSYDDGTVIYASSGTLSSSFSYEFDVDCGGVKPRFFAIEPGGKYLFCGNQMSDNLVLFRIDQESGALIPEGRELKTPCPVWILFTDTVPTVEQFGERKEVKA